MPKVKYKYQNESEKVINNADNYKVVPGVIPGTATEWQLLMKGEIVDGIKPGTNQPYMYSSTPSNTPNLTLSEQVTWATEMEGNRIINSSYEGGILAYRSRWIIPESPTLYIANWYPYSYYKTLIDADPYYPRPGSGRVKSDALNNNGTHWFNSFPGFNGGTFYTPNRTYVNINIEVIGVHPTNGTKNNTLKIFNGDNLVFSRTELIAPQYVEVIFDKQCPNNTCPVKCGDKVCCYGSDGISTENFLFSESIYQ